MTTFHKAHLAYEEARWLKHDSARWVRPDAARFLAPGTKLEDAFPALKKKYSPSQPRVPAGNPDGGQWTSDSGSGRPRVFIDTTNWGGEGDAEGVDGGIDAAADSQSWFERLSTESESGNRIYVAANGEKPILDSFGEPYYQRGGHHEALRSRYENWNLPPETKRVFDEATTGRVPRGYTRIDGQLQGHYWDKAHREYGDAFDELSEKFFRKNSIDKKSMNPDQARELLKKIRESEDPRIRDYNRNMRLLNRIFRLRGGRE